MFKYGHKSLVFRNAAFSLFRHFFV